MKTFQFKTTLKCNHCIAKVKEQLDAEKEILSWRIDLKHPDRILTVESDQSNVVEVVKTILTEKGFQIEPLL